MFMKVEIFGVFLCQLIMSLLHIATLLLLVIILFYTRIIEQRNGL